jgi:Fic family protein
MYEPNVKLTAALMASLAEIEGVRELLATIPIVPIVENHIQRKALVETVHFTARIEGNPLNIQAVERLGAHQKLKIDMNLDEQAIVNLYKAMAFVKDIAGRRDVPIDEKIVRQIHAYVVRDIPKEGTPGSYRISQNAVRDEGTGENVFLPPKPRDVPRLMGEFSTWLSQKPLAFHPVMIAGLAHLELVAIHPFDNGNGRTARALADLVLCRNGYSMRHLFSWVAEVGVDMATYHRTLGKVLGAEYGSNVDPTTWLEYFALSLAKALSESKPWLTRLRTTFVDAYNQGAKRGFSRDQVEAILFAATYGSVTTGAYMDATGLSRSTVVKRLNALVDAGVMKASGKGRSVSYSLIPGLAQGEGQNGEGVQLGLAIDGDGVGRA